MLVNLFLHTPIEYKQIEKYQFGALFVVSLYAIYNIKYTTEFMQINNFMALYLFLETFFLPFYKLDTVFHHIVSISFINYMRMYPNLLPQIVDYNIIFLKVETSSIFLCSSYFLKEAKNKSDNKLISYGYNVSNILFITSFFKYRGYDFCYYIVFNPEFYEAIIIKNDIISEPYVYITITSFILLNFYWFIKILKVAIKLQK